MLLSSEDTRKLQHIELDILKEFIRTAQQLGLKYYLMGGTMLGAVRHGGFIPWDDDIDVGMLREDYEKYLLGAPALLDKRYFLQSWKSDPGYPRISAKLRDNKTAFVEQNVRKIPMNHGVYIDIFPLDYYPDGKPAQVIFDLRDKLLKVRSRSFFSIPQKRRHGTVSELGARILSGLLSVIYPTLSSVMEAREKLYTSVKPSACVANHGGYWRKKETVPVEWYGDGVVGAFENVAVTLPSCYQEWLTNVYGDYMQLPPKEKQVSHHDLAQIDLDHPYTMK